MRASVFRPGQPLALEDIPRPDPDEQSVLLRVEACGVCRTDLHVLDGELPAPKIPVVPGHQIVGRIEKLGSAVRGFSLGERIGVPWLGGTCGHCRFCASGRENLCESAVYTGYQKDGGFADFACADARYCFAIPDSYDAIQAAPLLCAGLIGNRALRMTGDARTIGIYGFGAAGHIVAQIARHQGRRVFAFTRSGDDKTQAFARQLGAEWAGSSAELPPEPLEAAIIFAPDGALVPQALAAVDRGAAVVCGGIHMSDIPSFPYSRLWGERSVRSVANLTRRDGEELLQLAPAIPIHTQVTTYSLEDTSRALEDLRRGAFEGAAVVIP